MDLYFSLFYILLFIVSFLYASVGHGGASGYIAIMALFGFLPSEIKTNALMLNILVAGISFWQYVRLEKLNTKILIPLLSASIPMAYIGGSISLNTTPFKWILAIILVIPILRFLGLFPEKTISDSKPSIYVLLLIGGLIGLLSGLIGIGGGIILSPILILAGWTSVKQAAVLSALFIVVNSAAGLLGSISSDFYIPQSFYAMSVIAVSGGLIGSYLGVKRFNINILKKILAIVLIIAVAKLVAV